MRINLKTMTGKELLNSWAPSWQPERGDSWDFLALVKALENPQQEIVGWLQGKHLVALLLYRFFASTMEIDFLATAVNFRRRGFMEQLLKAEQEWTVAQEIWLEVHEKNKSALKFYQKMGFLQSGRRVDYYKDGGAALVWTWKRSINSIG